MHRHHAALPAHGRATTLLAGAVALALVFGAGCHDPGPGTTDPSTGTHDGTSTAAGTSTTAKPWTRPGAGHTANIDLVVITSDGKAAVTRDQIGGTRLWPALDGSIEPLVIPVQGPQQLSVETRQGGGFTVAAVDAAGGAKIVDVDANGKVVERGALAPFQPLFGIYVLPGGERLLALFRDHSIRLIDREAAELANLEERRFRPTSLRLSSDGKHFVAVLGASGSSNRAEVQVLELAGSEGKPTIRLVGDVRTIEAANPLSETTAVMSPDARSFAVVDKPAGTQWEILVVDLDKGESRRLSVPMPSHIVPNLGYVSAHELLVSTNDGSLSWLVELDDGSQRARTSAPQDFINQGRAQAMGGGVQVAGHGTWLFVHDVVDRSHRYLGYQSFQTQSVAVSPSGEWVAWAYVGGPVFVESIDPEHHERFEVPSEPSFGTLKVRFFDDEHLVSIDGAGGIHLHRWRDGELVDEAGIHGAIRALHFEPREKGQTLMLVERHNNDAHLFEVSTKGFAGPYIVADQSFRSGLLTHGSPGHEDAVMWTLDSGNRLRHYTLAELRGDLSQDAVMAKGDPIPPGKVAPLAIDRLGHHYGVRWNGSTMEMFVDFGAHLKTKISASGDVSAIEPSPSGKHFVAVHQRGQNTSLSVHDTETLEEQWSFSTGVFNNEVVWSPDGRFVAVAANTGAVVLDARTGKPVQRRCGIEFQAVGAAPSTAFNSLNLRSMCEG
ncbi:lactonase family protein [Paraliomyxa miuraensis]|uniref:hypothetical protein n=1 Tax=Paraliomyxa miuraensis TaxID=376150 RepID=UPI00225B3E9A|nr:hypothetical protein [Paraliomyxa miuraensis]MCX4242616.1 lactonase family protein [Paraliomyxa miuraensis]